jgi:lysophospholipase L1-like esterase
VSETVRFAAIGDSFTEGVGDELPDGSVRGWADDVAAGIAAVTPVEYVNLAIRGRLLEPIVREQLEVALALKPTVLTFNGGGNDLMRPKFDLTRLCELNEEVIVRCRDARVQLVVLSGANPSRHLPFGDRMERAGGQLVDRVRQLTDRYDVPYADNFSDEELTRPGYWSPDRLHLAAPGHRRVAGRVLMTLGYPVPDGWMEPLAAPDRKPTLIGEVGYYREHVVPWIARRITRRSSGDGREPKYATWTPFPATL